MTPEQSQACAVVEPSIEHWIATARGRPPETRALLLLQGLHALTRELASWGYEKALKVLLKTSAEQRMLAEDISRANHAIHVAAMALNCIFEHHDGRHVVDAHALESLAHEILQKVLCILQDHQVLPATEPTPAVLTAAGEIKVGILKLLQQRGHTAEPAPAPPATELSERSRDITAELRAARERIRVLEDLAATVRLIARCVVDAKWSSDHLRAALHTALAHDEEKCDVASSAREGEKGDAA